VHACDTMEPNSAAEILPGLYRAVLDRVAQLELAGHRDAAGLMRSKGTRIYSRSWDDRARRELVTLLRQHGVDASGQPRSARRARNRAARTA